MAQYDPEVPVIYPPPGQAYPPPAQQVGPYVEPTPPMGYPTRDSAEMTHPVPVQVKTRGDDFWKGCLAALCCCCVLDECCC